MERYFIIGYMGAGKTTLGKMLAKQKNLEFIDLDHFIEGRYLKTIGELFDEIGEEKFRQIESSVLKEIGEFENVVISTGGGAPCFFDNMEYMNKSGKTIYLKSSPESLIKRLKISGKSKRPLLRDKNDDELLDFVTSALNSREEFYNRAHILFNVENFTNYEEAEKITVDLINKLNV